MDEDIKEDFICPSDGEFGVGAAHVAGYYSTTIIREGMLVITSLNIVGTLLSSAVFVQLLRLDDRI